MSSLDQSVPVFTPTEGVEYVDMIQDDLGTDRIVRIASISGDATEDDSVVTITRKDGDDGDTEYTVAEFRQGFYPLSTDVDDLT